MISKFSVKKPYTVLVGVVLAIVLGVVSLTRMTADLLPSMSLPYVIVMTTYVGASPETVEAAVTKPIEASMATVSNIESINSVSSENYSMVILEFSQTANMDSISLEIRENLDQLTSYWTDDLIGNPIIMKLNPDMLPVMIAAAGVEGMDEAQVSAYVQNSVMPELESIEGVASVNATGLIEESVNVVIRQDKVDAVNRQIYASIDKQMDEAAQELADGRTEINEGLDQLADGKRELSKGQRELNNGKTELANGKTELETQQEETLAQLAETRTQLLTAKADLETMKMNATVDIATLQGLISGLEQMEAGKGQLSAAGAQLGGAVAAMGQVKDKLEDEYGGIVGNAPAVAFFKQQALAQIPDAELQAALEKLDWNTDFEEQDGKTTVIGLLNGYIAKLQEQQSTLEGKGKDLTSQIASMQNKIESSYLLVPINRNGKSSSQISADIISAGKSQLGTLNNQLAEYNNKIAELDQGLTELAQGEMNATIGFSNGMTQILVGEVQMQIAQSELDSAKSELENAEKQLNDALDQIEEGEEQLADAREEAYDKADMTEVLTVDTISGLLAAQNFSMPAGYVTEEGVSYMVRVGDKLATAEELAEMPLLNLHMEGVDVITLGDVADVFYVDNSDEVYANVNGSRGVILTIQKQTGYSTGEVSDLLAERFKRMTDENPDLQMITLMDQGIYIDLVMDSIVDNLVFGALLAILILILFLKDMRPTLVVAFSIPISLVTAVVCMYFSGITLNVISLSGLALGIGMLVDNSIVVIENIYRLRSEGRPIREAAIEGAREVAGAIMASTLTTICVFAPIVFTEGITRQLFVDMGLTIAYSLLASLAIALTVVPAMSSKLLNKTKEQKEGRIFKALVKGYEKTLALSLKAKPLVMLLVLVLLVVSVLAAVSNGTAFMTDMDSTQLSVSVVLSDDAALSDTAEVTDEVVARIREIDEIQDVGAMTSGSSMSMLTGGGGSSNAASVYVTTVADKTMSNEEIADRILEKTADLPAEITVDTSSMDMSAMGGSGITIRVEGRDLDVLQRIAGEVAAVVESVEGTAEVSDGMEESAEELRITVDRDRAMEYGLTVAQVFSKVSAKLAESGAATALAADEKDYNVYVISAADKALTRQLLQDLEIEGTGEGNEAVTVTLDEIADFEAAQSLTSISRSEQTRYLNVSAAIADGYNVGKVATEVERRLADYELPAGYSLVFAGENETINDAMEQVELMLLLALVFMYLIMVAQFQSLLSPFIIMFTIPLAFTGGFFGLFFTGSEVSVIAMIGFVMLSGIIVNNGIVLIDYMNQLRESGMAKREAILTAGRTRLRPVLMTALTTILALSTMVFSNDMGAEMMKPMAIVTIGGLVYGTLLTLIVIPCVYDIFTRRDAGSGKKERKWLKKKK